MVSRGLSPEKAWNPAGASGRSEGDGLARRWEFGSTSQRSVRSHMGSDCIRILAVWRHTPGTETCQETLWPPCEEPIHTLQTPQRPRRTDTTHRVQLSPAATLPILHRRTFLVIRRCPRPASWPTPGCSSPKPLCLSSPFMHWAILNSASAGCWLDLLSFSGGGETQGGRAADWAEPWLSLSKRREVSNRVLQPLICHHG